MAVHTATITAKTGAGQSVAAAALTDLRKFEFDLDKNIVYVTTRSGQVREFSGYSTIALTVTGTTAGSTYSLTLS